MSVALEVGSPFSVVPPGARPTMERGVPAALPPPETLLVKVRLGVPLSSRVPLIAVADPAPMRKFEPHSVDPLLPVAPP